MKSGRKKLATLRSMGIYEEQIVFVHRRWLQGRVLVESPNIDA